MKDSLELIIKDIYALDPSLVERDVEVRALVSAFSAKKPVVEIDAQFVASLRGELLTAAPVSKVIQVTPSPWWMVYGAPVGVMAILLLMLIPRDTPVQNQAPVEESSPVMEAEVFMDIAPSAADMKRSMPTDDSEAGAATMMMEADTTMMSVEPSGDTFSISTQVPGDVVFVDFVTLTQPGFLVIQAYLPEGPGEVLGLSPLLAVGSAQQIEIRLSVETEPEQTFYATLYLDDGDGLFVPKTDMLVYDMAGNPLQQIFSTDPVVVW